MTVITVTTVGYEEQVPLSRGGEIFTSVLLLSGLGVLFHGGRLTGVAEESLGTGDSRSAEALRFSFRRKGDVLRGTVAAVASGDFGFPLALSHWTLLRKTKH